MNTRSLIFPVLAVIAAGVATLLIRQHNLTLLQREYPAVEPEETREIDPALVKYLLVEEASTTIKQPLALAADKAGTVYFAGNDAICRWRGNGIEHFANRKQVYALAVGEDGTLYAAMKDHIEAFTSLGKPPVKWKSLGERAYLTGLAVHGKEVYAADAGNRIIVRYRRDGTEINRIGKRDTEKGVPGLVVPSPNLRVAVSKDGLVWVNNPGRHQVEAYAPDGSLKRVWGKASFDIEGFIGCCNPVGLALLPDGRVVTAEKKIPCVKVFRADGTLDAVVADPKAFTSKDVAMSLATTADGRILVLDPEAVKVRIFAPIRKKQ